MFKILIHSDSRYPASRNIIRKSIVDTLARDHLENHQIEVSVAVVGSRKMQELAHSFLGDREGHAVLAFPFEEVAAGGEARRHGFVNFPDGTLRLGEIILCWPELVTCAGNDNVTVDREIYKLTSHAVGYLLGKHDE